MATARPATTPAAPTHPPAAAGSVVPTVSLARPRRADARRNFDALLVAAKSVFGEQGTDASLEEIARRADVGIGTLYRNFPTRQALLEAVYVNEVEELCSTADAFARLEPWEGLRAWLDRIVAYVATKRALMEGLARDNPVFAGCRDAMYAAGGPLLERAQAAGEVRPDAEIGDVIRLVSSVASAGFTDTDQFDRVLGMALDGLRVR